MFSSCTYTLFYIICLDKNPHPDAKLAFEAVQEAHDLLSSPLKRAQHDEELRGRGWLRTLLSAPKALRYIGAVADNVKSRALLFSRRVSDGDVKTEVEEVKANFRRLVSRVSKKFSHFSRLPTITDRLELVGEMVFDKKTLLSLGFILLIFLL